VAACAGPSDPRLVVASQRIVALTKPEILNTIATLLGTTAADAIANDPTFRILPEERDLRFPPSSNLNEVQGITGDPDSLPLLDDVAAAAGKYVFDNFAPVTGCTSATDACSTDYLTRLAARAFRRSITSAEQSRLTGLFNDSRGQVAYGFPITSTVEEATQNAVYGILMAPQMLWRTEVGDPSKASTTPAGVPLTDDELATLLAFTLTDAPPDATLLAAAAGGQLAGNPANLLAQAERILTTQAARDWLSHIMFVYYRLSQLYDASPDPNKFPVLGSSRPILADMHDEAQRFVDYTLWNGGLTDILLSRTTFLNTTLANQIYMVSPPTGATATNFVQTNLPEGQRSGIITNAAFLTSVAGADRESVVRRGRLIMSTLTCLPSPAPPADVAQAVYMAKVAFDTQTAQEQVAYRASVAVCAGCHAAFDGYGLALDGYDDIARVRTTVTIADGMGGTKTVAVDPHATLPPALGTVSVAGAVDMAQKIAASDVFLHCQARNVLQLALADANDSYVEMPTPAGVDPPAAGCAALDVAQRYTQASGSTFADLLRAVVASPAFSLRKQDP